MLVTMLLLLVYAGLGWCVLATALAHSPYFRRAIRYAPIHHTLGTVLLFTLVWPRVIRSGPRRRRSLGPRA